MMTTDEMRERVRRGRGFIAALDQSGGSTPKALRGYGLEDDAWSGDEEMFARIHEMRARIVTSPVFTGDKVLGAILFERTMDGQADGRPVPALLHDRGVVPFLKIDKGLEEEADGVQRMKPIGGLDALLERARGLGVFGTKERSVINSADERGIRDIVAQQFELADRVLDAGLVPIIEPEVTITSADRADSDRLLAEALLTALNGRAEGREVMLKLSLPVECGAYDALVSHPGVLQVVALSGGYGREDACRELARNEGLIASFSRALLNDLRVTMSDEEFDRTLGEAIDAIYAASVEKVAA